MLHQKNKFFRGEIIEVMKPDGRNLEAEVQEILNGEGNSVPSAPHPGEALSVRLSAEAEVYDILRKKED